MHRTTALPLTLLLLTGVAHAQSTPPAQAPSPPAQTNPSNQAACPPDARPNSPTVGSGQSGTNLSDQLANSNGVICPPAGVDPEMRKPAPGGGRIQVVPPPGGPGGDPKTVPK
jgi:hypothetical protein